MTICKLKFTQKRYQMRLLINCQQSRKSVLNCSHLLPTGSLSTQSLINCAQLQANSTKKKNKNLMKKKLNQNSNSKIIMCAGNYLRVWECKLAHLSQIKVEIFVYVYCCLCMYKCWCVGMRARLLVNILI